MSNCINDPARSYWKHTGYTLADLQSLGKELDKERMLGIVEFRGSQPIHVVVSTNVADRAAGHAIAWTRFFDEMVQSWDGDPLVGSIGVWAEDGMTDWRRQYQRRAPLLTFGRHESDLQSLLVPDPAFMNSRGHLEDLARIDDVEVDLNWDDKKPIVFWRGANSSLGMNSRDGAWKNAARIQLALASKKMNNPEVLDAAISVVVDQGEEEFSARVHELGIVKPYVPFEEFLNYRYQVDVDGISCAWLSCFLKLASKSLMLKVQSPEKQWYYGELTPWKHYVPLANDLSDLNDALEWLKHHQQAAREIAEQGRRFIREYSYERVRRETAELIAEILSYQNDR